MSRRVVDLGRARAAEARLKELVQSGQLDPERTRAWLAGELEEQADIRGFRRSERARQREEQEESMSNPSNPPPTNIRLSAEQLEHAERLAQRFAERPEYRGLKLTRSGLLKLAIDRGMEAIEAELGQREKIEADAAELARRRSANAEKARAVRARKRA